MLFYKHNPNPIPPSVTVQELNATAETIIVLAEVKSLFWNYFYALAEVSKGSEERCNGEN